MTSNRQDLHALVTSFANSLVTAIEQDADARARATIATAFGVAPARGRGRPPKEFGAPVRPRKRMPRQLCPVPYCRNPAAPVFGMVCGKHRDVSKEKIREYREARRAKKA